MGALILKSVPGVWAIMMVATIATAWLAHGEAQGGFNPILVVILIAAFKARLVILHFMQLKTAPLEWRLIFEAWVVAVAAWILVGISAGS